MTAATGLLRNSFLHSKYVFIPTPHMRERRLEKSTTVDPRITRVLKYAGPFIHGFFFFSSKEVLQYRRASLIAQLVNNLPAVQEARIQFLGREDPLEKEMAPHSSTLAWKIPWTEEPGGPQSTGSQESDTT